MVDAEETWMQDAADALVEEMKEEYNREKPIVWNTIQMYRTGRLDYMRKNLERAKEKGYFIGYKLVRGAYMEKERNRAEEMGYPSPIQPNKDATDKNYHDGIDFVIQNLDRISAFFGTHNEKSTELLMDKMKTKGLQHSDPHIYFGQLYGMSDNITYFLSDKGYNVAKYLPYGPVKDVVPYLTRRAEENTAVKGQTGRELLLIEKELKRRAM
jgi:proline dehydrogenase